MDNKINVFETIKKIEQGKLQEGMLNHDKELALAVVEHGKHLLSFLKEKDFKNATKKIREIHGYLNAIEDEIESGEAKAEAEEGE